MNLVRPVAVLTLTLSVAACNSEDVINPNGTLRCEIPQTLQQNMLSSVNYYRSQRVACGGQLYNPVPALSWNSRLTSAAQVHANDMAQNDFFSHQGSDGTDGAIRIQNQGYNWFAWGENLASGAVTTVEAVDRLIRSPEHCVNIMNSAFTEMGGACAEDSDSFYGTYYVQTFGDR